MTTTDEQELREAIEDIIVNTSLHPVEASLLIMQLIEERIKVASTQTKSNDDVVQIAWLADGIDLWHRSNGKMGHSPADARRYIISSISRYVEYVIGDGKKDSPHNYNVHLVREIFRAEQRNRINGGKDE